MPDEVQGGGGYSSGPGFDGRLASLEDRVAHFEAAVDDIRKGLVAIRVDLAEIKGRLQNIPTTFQIAFMLAAFMVANFLGATALSLAILKLGSH